MDKITRADRANAWLGVLFPRLAARLMGARKYAAAKTATQTGSWNPHDSGVNDEIGTSKDKMNQRVRQLVRDMPHAHIAVNRVVDWSVGEGYKLQSRVLNDDLTINRVLSQQIEDAWAAWMDEADISGKLHFHEMAQLAKRQDVEIGEFIALKRRSRATGRFLPFAVQIFEGDVIGDFGAVGNGNNDISYGVEYNTNTGTPVAYHFETDVHSKATRVAASQVYHGFKTLRPNQLRGVSAFAPAVLMSHSLRDYLESEQAAQQMQAKWMAFITTADPTAAQAAFGAADSSTFNRKVQDLNTATIEYLAPNESIEFKAPNRGDSFDPFTKFVLRTFAGVMDISYELLSTDYSGMNYTTLRGVKNDIRKTMKTHIQRHKKQWYQPIFNEFMDWAVITGRLNIPRYFSDPWRYRRAEWIDPGMQPIDPLREGKAAIEAIDSLIMSPQEAIGMRGRDWQEVLAENKLFNETAEEMGLERTSISLSAKTNPAEVGAEEEEEEDE